MIGFCGAMDLCHGEVRFSAVRRMCGLHSAGCAFINREYCVLCDVAEFCEDKLQPVTVSYNNSLYTAAIISDAPDGENGRMARGVLEGYLEEGEDYIRRLDFSYALALYDGRCGELLLTKGYKGDAPLFYSEREGKVYFATSLRALMRLFGGCVRVRRDVLESHILGAPSPLPRRLFPDIGYVGAGEGMLCSRLGVSARHGVGAAHIYEPPRVVTGDVPPRAPSGQMRRYISDALFAFGYPQFDCYMPALLSYLGARRRGSEARVRDPMMGICREYSAERACRLGSMVGVTLRCVPDPSPSVGTRALKAMEKELDGILEAYLSEPRCVLHRLSRATAHAARGQREIDRRIRMKGMLIQTAMWFETYDLVLA